MTPQLNPIHSQSQSAVEERWRSLFETMAEGFFVGEMIYGNRGDAVDFRFLEVNPAFERLTGIVNGTGKTAREAIPGLQNELIATYAGVVATGEAAHFEVYIPALQNRWYEARARRTDPGCFAVLFLDITERKTAELQLRENETRQAALETLADQLRDITDLAALKRAAMEIVGTTLGVARAGYGEVDSSQELVSIENDWTDGRVPSLAGTYRFRDFGPELGESLRRGELVVISDVSCHLITASEAARWQALDIRSVVNIPLFENGKFTTMLFVQDSETRDWSEADLVWIHKMADRTWAAVARARALQLLQESEEFSRSVLASSPDCVKVVDFEGRLVSLNERGCAQMEIEDVSVCLNQPWANFWVDNQEMAEQAMANAKAGQTTRFEGYCPTAKGTPKWWEVLVTPIRDGSGNPVRILSVSRDITDRKRAEQERERLAQELARSNEDLSLFAHSVAHDLQSPLRGVASFAQLLKRRAAPRLLREDQEFVEVIIESAHRMQSLVEELLRFAQLGQGKIRKQPVAMDELVNSVLRSLQVQIKEQDATITCQDLPVVNGDSVQLFQLLQNLIANALKYSRPGEAPRIQISVSDAGGDEVFSIADNGQGIPHQHHAMIFEPLTRLHGVDVPGTGLGLAMCRRIVERHGGRIWVESEPGVGSTFFFALPHKSLVKERRLS